MSDIFAAVSLLELAAVVFGIAYLVLAVRQQVWCWPAALIWATLSLILVYQAQLYMQALLQVFYFALGIYGWVQWCSGGAEAAGVKIHRWRARQHFAAIATIAVLSLAFGYLVSYSQAGMPFLDSLSGVASIVTTYMVAKKVLENWLYWFVIDTVNAYLYLQQGLALYALLFVFYLVLIVIGFRTWYRDWERQAQVLAEPLAAEALD